MTQTDTTIVEIYTDGGCRGNPGIGGWGAVLEAGGHKKTIKGHARDTTNNRMEMTAAIEALNSLKRPCQVILHTDSTYVRSGITEWLKNWKRNNWKTAARKPVKNADLWQELDSASQRHQIDWRWVKGHAGVPGNELADQLANDAMDELKSQA